MNHMPLPTVDEIENKVKDIKAALAYQFKEEDVEKVWYLVVYLKNLFYNKIIF